jgi:NAD(P)-dependent dehydrogenase (short-subunit alcohol dehydrogenase family)
MDLNLADKIAVVTGASKGIGLAVVRELAAEGVNVFGGGGGVAATVGRATGSGADAVRDQQLAGMPTGRFTTPEEVATIVTLLCSPRSANVTGSNWVIDGGLIKTT